MTEVEHDVTIHAFGPLSYWRCTCGAAGEPVTRAESGRERHLSAVKRRQNGD